MIIEKIIYRASNGLDFLDEEKIQIGSTKKEQASAFEDFYSLIKDAEEINGFPLTHYKHSSRLAEPEYARLLIKIFNQKYRFRHTSSKNMNTLSVSCQKF